MIYSVCCLSLLVEINIHMAKSTPVCNSVFRVFCVPVMYMNAALHAMSLGLLQTYENRTQTSSLTCLYVSSASCMLCELVKWAYFSLFNVTF
jgi:hypothetical protein